MQVRDFGVISKSLSLQNRSKIYFGQKYVFEKIEDGDSCFLSHKRELIARNIDAVVTAAEIRKNPSASEITNKAFYKKVYKDFENIIQNVPKEDLDLLQPIFDANDPSATYDPFREIKKAAIIAIGEKGCSKNVEMLSDILKPDNLHTELVNEAIKAVLKKGNPIQQRRFIYPFLSCDNSDSKRVKMNASIAADCITEFKSPRFLDILRRKTDSSNSQSLNRRLEEHADVESLEDDESFYHYSKDDFSPLSSYIKALGATGSREDLSIIEDYLDESNNYSAVVRAAVQAFSNPEISDNLDSLDSLCENSKNPMVLRDIYYVINERGIKENIDKLEMLDQNPATEKQIKRFISHNLKDDKKEKSMQIYREKASQSPFMACLAYTELLMDRFFSNTF